MGLQSVILALHILRVCSASQIFLQNDDERLNTAAANIVNQCFGSSERWSELLIVPEKGSYGILERIHHQSRISNLIVFPDVGKKDDGLADPGKCDDYLNTIIEQRESKTTAVVIVADSAKHLENVLCFLRNDLQRLWRPGSYFLVVLDTKCEVAKCNDMFKVLWDYWILNAVILCPSNESGNRYGSEIELFTFNPYSGDHPKQWKTIIQETVEVSITPGKFNHSWHIFKQRFTEVGSSDECSDVFFVKTSNLAGYHIPVSHGISRAFYNMTTAAERLQTSLVFILETVANLLRFNAVEVLNNETDRIGEGGFTKHSFTGILKDLHMGRSHLILLDYPLLMYSHGFEMTYPFDTAGACLASRIEGNQPQWMNIVNAKQMWIGLGIGLLFSTVVLYLQDKSQGIVSALLNAERLIIGSSLIRTSVAIKHRAIIGSMLLVVLVIDGAIKGRFISMLSVVTPIPNIDSIDQIPQDMKIYGSLAFKTLVLTSKHERQSQRSDNIDSCLNDIQIEEHRQVCLMSCKRLMYHPVKLSVLHKGLAPVWTTPVAMFTTRYWPMKDRYDFELLQLVELGILRKWNSDAERDAEVEGWKQSRALEPSTVRPTELNDLLPAFLLLALGLSIALIVFVYEMKR